jgi:hypothetical protein
MLINIIDVGAPNTHAAKNGRSYQSLEVTYKDEQAQTKTKKLMSFSNPSVFNHIKNLGKGDAVNVVTTKDDNGYWQWTAIGADGGGAVQEKATTTNAASTGRVTGSNYETKEERAARQVYIVRQSSLSAAIGALSVGAKSALPADSIIALAKEFEAYVFDQKKEEAKSPSLDFDDIQDDVIL